MIFLPFCFLLSFLKKVLNLCLVVKQFSVEQYLSLHSFFIFLLSLFLDKAIDDLFTFR